MKKTFRSLRGSCITQPSFGGTTLFPGDIRIDIRDTDCQADGLFFYISLAEVTWRMAKTFDGALRINPSHRFGHEKWIFRARRSRNAYDGDTFGNFLCV